jgi:hypothetical protein
MIRNINRNIMNNIIAGRSFYSKVRAMLSGKRLYYVETLDRLVLATSYTQCIKKFPGHICKKAAIKQTLTFLLIP